MKLEKRNVLLTVLFLLMCNISVNAEKKHKIRYINNTTANTGILPKSNKKVVAVFEFCNVTHKKIAITEVRTSCGCTSVHYPKSAITPGSKVKIYVDVRTKYMHGQFIESALIKFDDGSSQILRVEGMKKYS